MKKLVLAGAAAIAFSTFANAPAQAAPFGTTPISPSKAACSQKGFEKDIACAAARTNVFLKAHGFSDVVRETVIAPGPPSALAWPSGPGVGSPLCGYADVPKVMVLGAHHCDRTTFIVRRTDSGFLVNENISTVVLIHESAHGVQEAAGLNPVMATLTGDVATQKPMELSGDCWSGVGTKELIGRGELPASTYDEAVAFYNKIGSKGDTLHGTGAERSAAYRAGYNQGVGACNKIMGKKIYR